MARQLMNGSTNPNSFWMCQVWNRRKRLFSVRDVVAMAIGLVAALLIATMSSAQASVLNLDAIAVTFAAISFGICIVVALLVLMVPSDGQRQRWSQSHIQDGKFSHLSDLVFVFTWSAMSQLIAIGASAVLYLANTLPTAPGQHIDIAFRILLVIFGIVCANAVSQMIAVVGTISQLAHVIEADASRDTGGTE